MTPVYCGDCGTSLGETAKFCRACGSAQAAAIPAQPLPPLRAPAVAFVSPVARSPSAMEVVAAVLAMVGGVAMCFATLYAVIYLPLHNEYAINYDQSPRLGDVVALVSGLVAVAIGSLLLVRRPANPTATGIWLVVAGTPTLIMALLWAFPETFDLTVYPTPFYLAFVYLTDLGIVHLGNGYVPLPLVIGCAMVIAAGFAIANPTATRAVPPAAPR